MGKQNADGGFGETVLSYNEPEKYNGQGKSTVSQTAWALLALIEVDHLMEVRPSIDKGVEYLVESF